ncbi:MAG: Holliday junction branch migration protein RuvA [Coriobacteriia bacterium]|nr:Holliday junction branch migration protein RuvA [Coriobacteriia bacterium]
MIGSLSGELAAITDDAVLIEVGGVGYRVTMGQVPIAALGGVGQTVRILTHMQVRENEVALYGFHDADARDAFVALLDVSGVGPRMALAILSLYDAAQLARIISADDVAALAQVSGIGKKTAQRIIIDLKGKLGFVGDGEGGAGVATVLGDDDVHAALAAMGFTTVEIAAALKGVDTDGETTTVIAAALRNLGGARS